MFTKKTKIISLLMAVVLLLCPLQAASAETQKTPEEKIGKQLFEKMERIPDGIFGVFVALDIDRDEIKRQAEKAWGKDFDRKGSRFNNKFLSFEYQYTVEACEKIHKEFMAKTGFTEQDRIVKLWWAGGVLIMANKKQIYRMAQMDEVQYFEYYGLGPVKTRIEKFTCEDALETLQIAVGLRSENWGVVRDVNLDGVTDVSDALLALQSAVGLRTIYWPDPLPFGLDSME